MITVKEQYNKNKILLTINKQCFQALAKTLLEKQRTDQPVTHKQGEAPKSTAGIDEHKDTVG